MIESVSSRTVTLLTARHHVALFLSFCACEHKTQDRLLSVMFTNYTQQNLLRLYNINSIIYNTCI